VTRTRADHALTIDNRTARRLWLHCQGLSAAPSGDASRILERIDKEGPLSSRDFDVKHTGRADKSKHAWARPPHKMMLEQLWLQGQLAVSHRRRFHKFYDLAERVIPTDLLNKRIGASAQTDRLCTLALERLGARRSTTARAHS